MLKKTLFIGFEKKWNFRFYILLFDPIKELTNKIRRFLKNLLNKLNKYHGNKYVTR